MGDIDLLIFFAGSGEDDGPWVHAQGAHLTKVGDTPLVEARAMTFCRLGDRRAMTTSTPGCMPIDGMLLVPW